MLELGSPEILILATTLLIAFYLYWSKSVKEIAERGLKFKQPVPYFGNNTETSLKSKHTSLVLNDIYKQFPNEKYFAYFNYKRVNIVVKDPQLISEITLKHFDHFVDHFTFFDEERDPLFFYGIFQLKSERWKDMRASLTPAFTSSKIKEMIPFIQECSKQLVSYVNECIGQDGNNMFETEAKSLMTKCANDVIASCTFGIETNSFKEPDNQFFTTAKNLTQVKAKDFMRFTLIMLFPRLAHFFNIHMMTDETSQYYRHIVKEVMRNREETGLVRRDMIHLLMLMMKGKLKNDKNTNDAEECSDLTNFYEKLVGSRGTKQNWKEDEITAQALNFVFAGFETSATVLSFMLYELAINKESQKRLQEEIDEFVGEFGEEIDYAHLNKMKYLEMVIHETLRLWPAVGHLDRLCTKEYILPPNENNSKGVKVNYYDTVIIPIYSLHRDEKYWENPSKFEPERFSDENKHNLTPNTYFPFGNGPRNCIGSRFAMVEIKIMIFYLLRHFDITTTPKTEIPLTITQHPFSVNTKRGIWVGLKRRNKNL